MDKNINKNRNYEKTESAIKKALIYLYKKKKSIDKITVKELCEVANISRSTFYLHYKDLISIFESVGDIFVASLKQIIDDLLPNPVYDFKDYINKMFDLIDESSELIKIALSLEYPFVYIDGIKNHLEMLLKASPYLSKYKNSRKQTLVEIRIVVSGIIDLIISLLHQENIDLKEYSEIINNFLIKWSKTLN
ncbi:MAG: TetR/AcrR family transcriptional regulator [Bacilli bacterium]|nr:TetR/AcrR family transcriptional regulator [Bacilli bacterium]